MADNNTPTWMDKLGGVKATYALGTALVGTGTLISGITVANDTFVVVGGVLTAVGTGLLMFFRAWTETTALKSDTTTTTKTVSAASNDKVTVQAALAPAAETKPVE
jgi:hypothetical protein